MPHALLPYYANAATRDALSLPANVIDL